MYQYKLWGNISKIYLIRYMYKSTCIDYTNIYIYHLNDFNLLIGVIGIKWKKVMKYLSDLWNV